MAWLLGFSGELRPSRVHHEVHPRRASTPLKGRARPVASRPGELIRLSIVPGSSDEEPLAAVQLGHGRKPASREGCWLRRHGRLWMSAESERVALRLLRSSAATRQGCPLNGQPCLWGVVNSISSVTAVAERERGTRMEVSPGAAPLQLSTVWRGRALLLEESARCY